MFDHAQVAAVLCDDEILADDELEGWPFLHCQGFRQLIPRLVRDDSFQVSHVAGSRTDIVDDVDELLDRRRRIESLANFKDMQMTKR